MGARVLSCSSSLTLTVTLGRVLEISHFWVPNDFSRAEFHGSQGTSQGPLSLRSPLGSLSPSGACSVLEEVVGSACYKILTL